MQSADDDPVAVIQGYGFDLTWQELNEAAIAIHRGAYWVATNIDPTRPTDRGLVPGNGAAVAAVRMTVDRDPEVAGKPYRPLLDDTVEPTRAHPPAVRRRSAGHRHRRSGQRRSGQHAGALRLPRATRAARTPHPESDRPIVGEDLRALLRPALGRQPNGGEFTVRSGDCVRRRRSAGRRQQRLERRRGDLGRRPRHVVGR